MQVMPIRGACFLAFALVWGWVLLIYTCVVSGDFVDLLTLVEQLFGLGRVEGALLLIVWRGVVIGATFGPFGSTLG